MRESHEIWCGDSLRHVEASIQISNIALIDPKTKETTRVGIRVEGNKKVRFSKKSNQVL